jgi:hypothetical protein
MAVVQSSTLRALVRGISTGPPSQGVTAAVPDHLVNRAEKRIDLHQMHGLAPGPLTRTPSFNLCCARNLLVQSGAAHISSEISRLYQSLLFLLSAKTRAIHPKSDHHLAR